MVVELQLLRSRNYNERATTNEQSSHVHEGKQGTIQVMKLVRSLNFDMKVWLHRSMVDPILLHGAEVWVAQNRAKWVQQLGIYNTYTDKGRKPIPGETSKRSFVRVQMGAPRFAPVLGIRGDSGEYPLYIEGLARPFVFLEKEDKGSLLGAALQTQKELVGCDQECWLLTIQEVEDKITNLNSGKKTGNKAEIIKILRNDYKKNWRKELKDCNMNGRRNSRARWYRKFKRVMKRENYLNGPKSDIQVAIARLRLGGHNFPVEMGRWANKKFIDRKCDRCQLNKVGTILHCFQCIGNTKWLHMRGIRINNEKRLIKIMKNPSLSNKLGIRDLVNSYR